MGEFHWQLGPLTLDDCEELGRVHIQVWREAYAGQMPADYLAGLSESRSASNWRHRLLEPEARTRGATTLVAKDDAGRIVGFASAGPSVDEDAPTVWQLYVINLLAEVHGTGLADELLAAVLGDRDATLWVVEGNVRARAFYARHGFVDEGTRTEHEATGTPEIRLVRRRAG